MSHSQPCRSGDQRTRFLEVPGPFPPAGIPHRLAAPLVQQPCGCPGDCSLSSLQLCQPLGAAGTESHKRGAQQQKCIVSGSPRASCWQGHACSKTCRGESLLASVQLPVAGCHYWVSGHQPNPIWLHFTLSTSGKALFPNQGTFICTRGSYLHISFWEHNIPSFPET